MALHIYDTMVPQGDYPAVKAEHVEMPDGTRLDQYQGTGTGSGAPAVALFDLAALGLPTLDADTAAPVTLETDTAQILAAAERIVQYCVNITYRGLDFTGITVVLCPGSSTAIIALNASLLCVSIHVTEGKITAAAMLQQSHPNPAASDNGKILEVVDGMYALVAVKDSSVAAYLDEYMEEALGGEY